MTPSLDRRRARLACSCSSTLFLPLSLVDSWDWCISPGLCSPQKHLESIFVERLIAAPFTPKVPRATAEFGWFSTPGKKTGRGWTY